MITEDYVSFETAKLLKEKGFGCGALLYYYDKDGDLLFSAWKVDDCKNEFDVPTLQMAMKWLRDVHHITIAVIPLSFTLKGSENFICNNWAFNLWENGNPTVSEFYGNQTAYSTYEEAAEGAIKYCLENLI